MNPRQWIYTSAPCPATVLARPRSPLQATRAQSTHIITTFFSPQQEQDTQSNIRMQAHHAKKPAPTTSTTMRITLALNAILPPRHHAYVNYESVSAWPAATSDRKPAFELHLGRLARIHKYTVVGLALLSFSNCWQVIRPSSKGIMARVSNSLLVHMLSPCLTANLSIELRIDASRIMVFGILYLSNHSKHPPSWYCPPLFSVLAPPHLPLPCASSTAIPTESRLIQSTAQQKFWEIFKHLHMYILDALAEAQTEAAMTTIIEVDDDYATIGSQGTTPTLD